MSERHLTDAQLAGGPAHRLRVRWHPLRVALYNHKSSPPAGTLTVIHKQQALKCFFECTEVDRGMKVTCCMCSAWHAVYGVHVGQTVTAQREHERGRLPLRPAQHLWTGEHLGQGPDQRVGNSAAAQQETSKGHLMERQQQDPCCPVCDGTGGSSEGQRSLWQWQSRQGAPSPPPPHPSPPPEQGHT